MISSSEKLISVIDKVGKLPVSKETPDYLSELAKNIASAREVTPVFSSLLDSKSAPNYDLQATLRQIDSLLLHRNLTKNASWLIEEHPDFGINVSDDRISLFPANSRKFPLDHGLLIHQGHVLINNGTGRIYNNRDNIDQVGLFGSPDFGVPTYLQLPETKLVQSNISPRVSKTHPVYLYIDSERLLKKRSLYPDPEGIINENEFGKSFFVLGGIPARAILAISSTSQSPLIEIPY